MLMSHMKKWSVIWLIFMIISCQQDPTKDAREVAEKYLEYLYSIKLDDASKFCTKKGQENLAWFASNLTDNELSLIHKRPIISILKSEIQSDTLILVSYRMEQGLVADSLEHVGHIGTKEGTLEVVRVGGKWKIQSEW